MLYATDFPFVPHPAVQLQDAGLDAYLETTGSDVSEAICHGNAEALFPQLGSTTYPQTNA